MRDHSPGHDPTERVPLNPPPELAAILRRLETGNQRRRQSGYVNAGAPDPNRKTRRKAAKLSRRRNR